MSRRVSVMVGCCKWGREVVASWTDNSGVGHLRQLRRVLGGQQNCWMIDASGVTGLWGSHGCGRAWWLRGDMVASALRVSWGVVLRVMRPLGGSTTGVPVGFSRCVLLVVALVSCGYCDSCRVNVLLLALVGVWRRCCACCPCGACVLMGCGAMASLVLAVTSWF